MARSSLCRVHARRSGSGTRADGVGRGLRWQERRGLVRLPDAAGTHRLRSRDPNRDLRGALWWSVGGQVLRVRCPVCRGGGLLRGLRKRVRRAASGQRWCGRGRGHRRRKRRRCERGQRRAAGLRRRADAARERKLPGDVRRGSTGSVVLVRRRVHGLRRLLRRLRCGVPCRWRRPEHRLHTGLVSKRDARVRERKRVLLRRRVHGLRRLLQQQAERVQLKLRLVGPPRKRPARVDPRCRDGAPPSSR